MKYEFPEIKTIDDVLPHIEGRKDFIVAERDFGFVINYNVTLPDSFPPIKSAGGSAKDRAARQLTAKMRRECRGIKFYPDGKIAARTMQKFFNVNEKDETQFKNIDLSENHVILDKLDGSMIHPILHKGKVRLCTKMGFTEIAEDAEKWLRDKTRITTEWLYDRLSAGITDTFEWTSPNNRIVVSYDEPMLTLLASRENISGKYVVPEWCPFEVVKSYGSAKEIRDFVDSVKDQKGIEGFIGRFSDGHMFKIKTDEYVFIHKTLDNIRFDRHIVDAILKGEIDDTVSKLPEQDQNHVREFEKHFWKAFEQKENRLYGLRIRAQQSYNDDRKRIAIDMIPNLENKADASFVFRMIDGHDLRNMMLEHIKQNTNTNVKWDACAIWMGMEKKTT